MRTKFTLRHAIIAALALVLMLSGGVARPAQANGERVLLDMTVRVLRAQEYGICMQIEPGTVAATVQAISPGIVPVRFVFGPYGNVEVPDGRINTMAASAPVTYLAHITQEDQGYTGFVCYTLRNEAPLPQDRRVYADEVLQMSQMVALKLVWSPA